MAAYYRIYCTCGRIGLIVLSRWLHRDEVLRRARCTVCGRRGAADLTWIHGQAPDSWSEVDPAMVNLPVIKV